MTTTVVIKGHGHIDQRLTGIYRSRRLELPRVGERVRVAIDDYCEDIDGVVCEVNVEKRTYDVSLLENMYNFNRFMTKIQRDASICFGLPADQG